MIKIFLIQNLKKILLGLCLILGLVVIYLNYYLKSTTQIVSDNDQKVCNCIKDVSSYFIEVMGQVINPGVYEVEGNKLVIEAIELAGGYTSNADLAYVHRNISLSSTIKPTQKIYIPAVGENFSLDNSNTFNIDNGKINLNTASKQILMTISGVGEVTAEKIIEIRPIKSMDDLDNLSNVPKKTIDNIIAKSEL